MKKYEKKIAISLGAHILLSVLVAGQAIIALKVVNQFYIKYFYLLLVENGGSDFVLNYIAYELAAF